jgi:hypothetical protein
MQQQWVDQNDADGGLARGAAAVPGGTASTRNHVTIGVMLNVRSCPPTFFAAVTTAPPFARDKRNEGQETTRALRRT